MERGNCLLFPLPILGCIKCQEEKLALTARNWHTVGLASAGLGAAAPRDASEHPLASAELRAQQELDWLASHVGSHWEGQQFSLKESSCCLMDSCWPVSPPT